MDKCVKAQKPSIYTVYNVDEDDRTILFCGPNKDTETIINRFNNGEILKKDEKQTLVDNYGNIDLENARRIAPLYILPDDDIYMVKKKILTTFFKETNIPNIGKMLLYGKITDSGFKDALKERPDNTGPFNNLVLGYNYQNNMGIKYLNTNLKTEAPGSNDKLIDQHGYLLEKFPVDNVLFFRLYNERLPRHYFPFLNTISDVFYDLSNINNVQNNYVELTRKIDDFGVCPINKILVKVSIQKALNVQNIFDKLKLDKQIVFAKYKNQYFKINSNQKQTERMIPLKGLKGYYLEYEQDYYNPKFSKRQVEIWAEKTLNDKEKMYIKEQKYIDPDFINLFNNSLVIQAEYADNRYAQFTLMSHGECLIKYDNKIDDLDKFHNFIETVLLSLDKKIVFEKKDMSYISCETEYEIDTVDKKANDIQQALNFYKYYGFSYPSGKKNVFNLKFIKLNNYNSSEKHKQFFFQERENNDKLSLSEFNKLWIEKTHNLFGLSESEALAVRAPITEEYSRNELKKNNIDYETNVSITRNFKKDDIANYTINIENAGGFSEISRIRTFIAVLFLKEAGKTTKKNQIISEIIDKTKRFEEQDDLDKDLDIDLGLDILDEDLDLDMDEMEDELDIEEQKDDAVPTELAEEPVPKAEYKPEVKIDSVRKFMTAIRNKDTPLLKFKTSKDYPGFSIKCGAVDNRQPIILTPKEFENFKEKNPEAYEEMTNMKKNTETINGIIEWGSSKRIKNYYMAPRIFCIHDMVPLTVKQFLDNDGKCPFCSGKPIIDEGKGSKSLPPDQTILIRRGGSNNYWGNTELLKKKIEEWGPKWEKYLKGTEKDAFPGFLDPKLHPKGLAMPCCNIYPHKNYALCMVHRVKLITDKSQTGELEDGDQIVLFKKDGKDILFSGVKEKHNGTLKSVSAFTNLEIQLTTGMHFEDAEMNLYKYKKETIKGEIKEVLEKIAQNPNVRKNTNEDYFLGQDKFPIGNNKLGMLNENLDIILNNISNELIKDSRRKEGTKSLSVLARMGVTQVKYNSFLQCMAKICDTSRKELTETIINNLSPELFLSLENGNIYKMFSNQKATDYTEYTRWCKSPLNKDFIEDDGLLAEDFKQDVFFAIERFKNYIGDMNVYKYPYFFVDLFSRKLDWLPKEPLNVIIIEHKATAAKEASMKDTFMLHHHNCYKAQNKAVCLYLYRKYFEPIVISFGKRDKSVKKTKEIKEHFFVSQSFIGRMPSIIAEKDEADYAEKDSYLPTKELVEKKFKDMGPFEQIIDEETFYGIGVRLNNGVVVFTQHFRDTDNEAVLGDEKRLLPHEELLEKLKEIRSSNKYKYVVSDKKIIGILLPNKIIHPCKKAKLPEDIPPSDIERFDLSGSGAGMDISKARENDQHNSDIINYLKGALLADHKEKREEIISLLENPIVTMEYKINNVFDILTEVLSNDVALKTKKSTRRLLENITRHIISRPALAREVLFNETPESNSNKNILTKMDLPTRLNAVYGTSNFYIVNNFKDIELSRGEKNIVLEITPEMREAHFNSRVVFGDEPANSKFIKDMMKKGKCRFPFKHQLYQNKLFYDCTRDTLIGDKLKNKFCATELSDGTATKYGECVEASIQSKLDPEKKAALKEEFGNYLVPTTKLVEKAFGSLDKAIAEANNMENQDQITGFYRKALNYFIITGTELRYSNARALELFPFKDVSYTIKDEAVTREKIAKKMKKTQKIDNIGMTDEERLKEFCKGDDKDKKIEYDLTDESIWGKFKKQPEHNTLYKSKPGNVARFKIKTLKDALHVSNKQVGKNKLSAELYKKYEKDPKSKAELLESEPTVISFNCDKEVFQIRDKNELKQLPVKEDKGYVNILKK